MRTSKKRRKIVTIQSNTLKSNVLGKIFFLRVIHCLAYPSTAAKSIFFRNHLDSVMRFIFRSTLLWILRDSDKIIIGAPHPLACDYLSESILLRC